MSRKAGPVGNCIIFGHAGDFLIDRLNSGDTRAFITSTSYSPEFSVLFWNAAASAGSDESFLAAGLSAVNDLSVVEADGESPSEFRR